MTKHFIHYIPRRVIMRYPSKPNDRWFAELQSLGDGFKRPMFHIARNGNGAVSNVEKGDKIWVVAQLHSPWGKLPPSVDARIDVGQIQILNNGKIRFSAEESSVWFPFKDGARLLENLETITPSGQINPLWSDPAKPIGIYIQSMRMLVTGNKLDAWEQELKTEQLNFISYRICDGTRQAFKKVKFLIKSGKVVFWDRWSLPRRLAERREIVTDKALDDYLIVKLEESAVVWGIETQKYSVKGSYSAKEQQRAKEMHKYKAVTVE